MLAQRKRALMLAAAVVVTAWALALGGYWLAKRSKMSADKVRAYAASVDLNKLSGSARTRALDRLADKLNALPYDERQRARFDRVGMMWWDQMTDQEKSALIEKTMPTGFKQMIAAFEQMPENKRRDAIDRATRGMREARARIESGEAPAGPPGLGGRDGGPRDLTPEMQEQIRKLGLKSYFTQSSAQTKAELAPLLEELQRTMELSGRFHR